MVDVSQKPATARKAIARALIHCRRGTQKLIEDAAGKKGDVLAVVRIAAIAGAKRTSDLIPLCHPLSLSKVTATIEPNRIRGPLAEYILEVEVSTTGPTGVEMEALTGASVGALTFYDMVKKNDRDATFSVMLVSKSGGASGPYARR